MNLKGKTIAFLGDSITKGVGASSNDKIFHQLLIKKYGLKRAINYGISGITIAKRIHTDDLNWKENYFCNRVSIMCDDADAVVVFGGTNDYGHGDAPYWMFY